jgi:NAD-reducing hydrogenase large subunit
MPQITARICGICPVSHLLASAKACDAILGVEIPRPAKLLRELLHMGQITQSHALSFFHLSAPDLLLGFDSDPKLRNVMGLIAAHPDIARRGIRLRKFGQDIIQLVGGRKVHANFSVAGGVNQALSVASRDQIRAGLPEAMDNAKFALDLLQGYQAKHQEEVDTFAAFDSNYMGLVRPSGALELYDGKLRFCDTTGKVLEDQIEPAKYGEVLAETTESWSFLKFPFIKGMGYPDGIYRVGPLPRLNVASHISTPQANAAFKEWHAGNGKSRPGSFYYHSARLVEIIYALERIEQLLGESDITSTDLVVTANPSRAEGVGIIEAPRGTLFHHYWVDEGGRIEKVNLIVATGHNNLAMNRAVLAVAKKYVKGKEVQEGMLNRVEAAIRCYDPCLSCSTHAIGQMPMQVELMNSDGTVLQTLSR